MAESKTFPVTLRWLLLAPLAVFFISYALPKSIALVAFLLACATELLVVPVAIFYLLRGGYRTVGNVAMTVVGAIPAALVLAIVFTLKFGHFHI